MADLSMYYQMVENCIKQLGVDPVTARGEDAGQWALVKGSARVWLDLWHIEREGRAYFQVLSPVMKVSEIVEEKRAELYEEVLKINHTLYGVAFTLHNDFLWIKVIRETDDLSEGEVGAMIQRVGSYSDEYDDYLIKKYLPPQPPAEPPHAPNAPMG